MAQRILNLGTPPRGTDGDTARQANEKVNANFAELYATKQDAEAGKGLSTNDYSNAEKTKLAQIQVYDQPANKGALSALNPDLGWVTIGPSEVSGVNLPPLETENATFRDEGTSPDGWVASDMAIAISDSVLRATKTNAAGAGAQISRGVALPANGKDYILFVRMRSNTGCVCWLNNSASDRLAILWLNAGEAGVPSAGTLSITGYRNDGASQNARFAEGFDTSANWVEVALHYDSKFASLSVYQRKPDGSLEYKNRVPCDHNNLNGLTFRTLSSAPAGAWIEFDYVQISAPNLVVVGDSIAEGKNGFSPNPSLGLANYLSTWVAHAPTYAGLRNNLIVNKGVGSQTSAMIRDRSSEYAGIGAKVVFVHASSNDTVGGISQSARTSNIQATVDAIRASGASAVLLNAMYGTAANSLQPGLRNYMAEWWGAGRLSLTGLSGAIDIMQPLRTADNFMRADLTDSDGIHPTVAGYRTLGNWVYGSAKGQLLLPQERKKLQSIDPGAQVNPGLASQAEAEAGTGTNIRGWPVVRVWQAVAAWVSKNLGTAAAKNVTTSSRDTTTDRVLKVGDFGLGKALNLASPNLNNVKDPGFYYCNSPINAPRSVNGYLLIEAATPDYYKQTYSTVGSPSDIYVRQIAEGAPTPWVRLAMGGDAIGEGQAWQDFTSARALTTNYVNNTGRAIAILAFGGPASVNGTGYGIRINGVELRPAYGSAGEYISTGVVVIPPGASYSVVVYNGMAPLVTWQELR